MSDGYTIGWHRGKWCLTYYDEAGKRKRPTLGTTDPSQAKRLAPALYAELTRPNGSTVAALWEAYRLDMAGRTIAENVVYSWKPLQERFGFMDATQITIADCRAHTAERRAAGISDGTIHTELGHLRSVLLWAKKHRMIDEVPAIERPSKPKPKTDYLTREQCTALIRAASAPHVRLAIILLMATGARVTALLELTWDRVDLQRGLINLVNPKTIRPSKGRAVVPINNMARTALEEARARALSEFVVEWAGKPVTSIRRGVTFAGKAIGLAKMSPHVLRHTAAVHMAEDGVPMDEIAQYLGHSDVGVTRKVYARFSPDYLRKAAGALEYEI